MKRKVPYYQELEKLVDEQANSTGVLRDGDAPMISQARAVYEQLAMLRNCVAAYDATSGISLFTEAMPAVASRVDFATDVRGYNEPGHLPRALYVRSLVTRRSIVVRGLDHNVRSFFGDATVPSLFPVPASAGADPSGAASSVGSGDSPSPASSSIGGSASTSRAASPSAGGTPSVPASFSSALSSLPSKSWWKNDRFWKMAGVAAACAGVAVVGYLVAQHSGVLQDIPPAHPPPSLAPGGIAGVPDTGHVSRLCCKN